MTTDEKLTPAAELRAAASKIRDLTNSIPGGPWSMLDSWRSGDETVHVRRIANADHEDVLTASGRADLVGLPSTFEYIAMCHPGVASAVADWLVTAAAIAEQGKDPSCVHRPVPGAALRVARLINGGAR